MPELTVTLDPKDIARFRRLMRLHPMMAAKSLTFVAEKAVPAWRAGNAVFHRRNTWIDRGVRMRPASPGNLNAEVGTLDRFMGRHVVGIAEPKEGRLFIPIYRQIGEALTHTQERRALARMGQTKRKPFLLRTGKGEFLVRRTGKGRSPLTILGKIQQGAKIKPELDALGIVSGVVAAEFGRVYQRILVRWAETGKV